MKILIIEDDHALANGLCQALQHEGFATDWAGNGSEGLALNQSLEPDLIVLDLGLPDISGQEVLDHLRRDYPRLPILILTARDAIEDKVTALDRGADDYLSKPFEIAELMARLRVLARRISTASTSNLNINGVELDLAAHSASTDGELLNLTRREYMILKALMENAGRVQTKDALENKLYGWGEEIASNTIEVHISNLRKKLPDNFITTIRGVGYTVHKPKSAG